MSRDLKMLRSKLHAVDEQIIVLMAERLIITREIGFVKRKEGIPIEQPETWQKMRAERETIAEHYGADVGLISALFEMIHQYSIKEQKNA